MEILTFDELPKGGFAGLIERQFVTDERVFGRSNTRRSVNGIGNFVYLADANFLPKGETGMHTHHEIDVISVMVDGRIDHAGSLQNGQGLDAGTVQIQRAGGEGFAHNEINPDDESNHMIQLWVLPDEAGEPAGYRVYSPQLGERTQVYGGQKDRTPHFYSQTSIDVAVLEAGQQIQHDRPVAAFLSKGSGTANGEAIRARTLVRADRLDFTASADTQLILVYSTD